MRININLHTNQAKINIVRGSRPQDERTKQNHVRDLRSQDSWQHVLTQTKTLSLIFMQMWFVHHLCLCSGSMKISFCFYEIFGFCVENCKYVGHLFYCLWNFQIFMKISYFYENFICFMKISNFMKISYMSFVNFPIFFAFAGFSVQINVCWKCIYFCCVCIPHFQRSVFLHTQNGCATAAFRTMVVTFWSSDQWRTFPVVRRYTYAWRCYQSTDLRTIAQS